MLNFSGFGGVTGAGVPGIGEWGESTGEDGNTNNIPGAGGENDGAPGNRPGFGDTAGRRGPGAGPDYSGVASDLLGRVSSGLGSGEKMGGGVAAAPSPGDALGGIASHVSVTRMTGGTWQQSTNGDETRTTNYYLSDGSRVVTRDEIAFRHGRLRATTTIVEIVNGEVKNITVTSPPSDAPEEGSGDAGKGKGIAKQQDPNADNGTVVWIPPSCGSAKCNEMRNLLNNPKSALQQSRDKMGKVSRPDRDGGGTGTTQRLVIDQHGLVVSYGADSGPAGSGGGRVHRFESRQDQVQ